MHFNRTTAKWALGILSSAFLAASVAAAGGGGGISGGVSAGTSTSSGGSGAGAGGSSAGGSGGGGHSGGSSASVSVSGSAGSHSGSVSGHSGSGPAFSGAGHSSAGAAISGGAGHPGAVISGGGGRHFSGSAGSGGVAPSSHTGFPITPVGGKVTIGGQTVAGPFGDHRLGLFRHSGQNSTVSGSPNFHPDQGTHFGTQGSPAMAFGGHSFPRPGSVNGGRQFTHHPAWDHGLDHLWHGHRYRWFGGGVYGGAWYICDDGFYPYGPITADDVNPIYDDPAGTTALPDYNGPPSVESQVQIALAELGYYHGEIDGYVNAGLTDAILRYQREHKLLVTGEIDQALLDSLFAK